MTEEQRRIISKFDDVPEPDDPIRFAQLKNAKAAMTFLAKLMKLNSSTQRKLVTYILFSSRKGGLSREEIAVLFGPNVDEWFFESILEGHPGAYALSILDRLEKGNYKEAKILTQDLSSTDLEGLLSNWENLWLRTHRPEAAFFCYFGLRKGILMYSSSELREMIQLLEQTYPLLDETFWNEVTH